MLALAVSLFWAYWTTLTGMVERWTHEAQYSHGYLVPVFAGFLLWQRRGCRPSEFRANPWGLAVCLAAVGLRLGGTYFHLAWIDAISLIGCLLGCCLLLGGWSTLRWAWPALAFLVFMLPLPFFVERALAQPLQRLATSASTFLLVILGFPATSQGNIITINEHQIGVVEACGGLSMLLTFLALATACAMVIRRPLVDRIVVVLSAIPIALLANVVRITVTGTLYEIVGDSAARIFFHDIAGWFMMLLALILLWVELWILSRLFIDGADAPLPLFGSAATGT